MFLNRLYGDYYKFYKYIYYNIINKIDGFSIKFNNKFPSYKDLTVKDYLFTDTISIYSELIKIVNELESYLITLTHNRKHIFPLAILNYNASKYPKDKIEWIICDDGTKDNKVRSLLPDDEAMKKMNNFLKKKLLYQQKDQKILLLMRSKIALLNYRTRIHFC